MMKKTLMILLVLTAVLPSAFAQQITKVGVVNVGEVIDTFYRESKDVREIYQKKEEVMKRIQEMKDDIRDLERELELAEDLTDTSKVRKVERSLRNKKRQMEEYIKIKDEELNKMYKRLVNRSEFKKRLLEAIEFVAKDEGYSVIFESDKLNLLYWSKDVDVTELVIKRMIE